MAAISFSDALLILKGDKVDLSQASVSDFDNAALCEGEINMAFGPFATYETTETRFGVVKDKRTTNFYLVGNVDPDAETEDEYFKYFAVLSCPDTNIPDGLDKLCEEFDEGELSGDTVAVKGKLAKHPTDEKYKDIFSDLKKDGGFSDSEIGKMRIMTGNYGMTWVVLFLVGIAVALISLIIMIVMWRKQKKRDSETDFY